MSTHEQEALLAAVRAQLDTHLEYIRRDFKEIKTTLALLQRDGCEKGRSNERAIARIQQTSENRGTVGGAVGGGAIAIVVSVVAGVLEYLRR
jgi:hypothetical protein